MCLVPLSGSCRGFGVFRGMISLTDSVRHWRIQNPYPFAAVGIALAFFISQKIGNSCGGNLLGSCVFKGVNGQMSFSYNVFLGLWNDGFGVGEDPWKKQVAVSHFRTKGDQTLLPERSYHLKFT
jgi:hypothetical protein